MATKLYFRDTTDNGIAGYWDLVTTAGSSVVTMSVYTENGPAELQLKEVVDAIPTNIKSFITGRVPAGGFTLTATDISAWLYESSVQCNCTGRYRVFKYSGGGETEIGGGPFTYGTEIDNSYVEYTWSGNVTDTAFAEDDRLVVKVYVTDAGGVMKDGAKWASFRINAADATQGDSWFNIAETVAFKAETPPSVSIPRLQAYYRKLRI